MRLSDGVALVMLAGEIDVEGAALVGTLLQQAVATGAPSVIVDMALVSFCDARGLGQLVHTSNELQSLDSQLSIRAASASLRRLFALTGLTGALHVEASTAEEGRLATDLATAARTTLTRSLLDASLRLVVVMSQAVMRGADGVSITLPRDGELRTVAASNDVVLQMDHDQYDTGEGPCLDAATHGELFSAKDLESEPRWPLFVPRARSHGIESIMSTPLMSGDRPLGALNVYSRAPDALASHEQEWATLFAQEASRVLLAAHPTATVDSVDADLREALRSREVIALAQGIIMGRRRLQPDEAYRVLTEISRQTSKPLLHVCTEVISTTAPDPVQPDPGPAYQQGEGS
ncbi:MAG: anti-sigma factor antagonist [Mycobacteriales bacterium]|nr:anti-sigma factor antagonist [Mycobacteriales bacterium]